MSSALSSAMFRRVAAACWAHLKPWTARLSQSWHGHLARVCRIGVSPMFAARRCVHAFSLLEVVVALGIFALGLLAVLGMFGPLARSVGVSSDAEAATRIAEPVRLKLQAMPFADVAGLLKKAAGAKHELTEADARPDYNPASDPQILFASRDGAKIGVYGDPVWKDAAGRNSDREKFFEIALVRNETLSPAAADETAVVLAYVARVRWPSFVPDGATGAIQVGSNPNATVKFDHGTKQVAFFPGSIVR